MFGGLHYSRLSTGTRLPSVSKVQNSANIPRLGQPKRLGSNKRNKTQTAPIILRTGSAQPCENEHNMPSLVNAAIPLIIALPV